MFFRSFHSLSPKRRLMGRFAKVAWVLKIASVSLLPAAVTSAALSTKAQAQTGKIGDALDSLGITLPDEVLRTDSLRQPLDELARERCDGVAIASLGDALEKIGRRREAAIAQIAFSRNCDGHASAVRRAVNILLALNDPAAVVSAATELIKLEPYGDNGYFLRALGHHRAGNCQKAIDDYATAIELFGNKQQIASVGYFGMMRCYERLGRFCDATAPIETWVAINPDRNDTSQTRTILAELSDKGKCASAAAPGEEVLPIGRPGQTVTITGSINGVSGRFIIDTGATFVALKRSYAQRANVEVDESSSVKLGTANGIAEARRGRAKSVAVKRLSAQDVAVIVQTDDRAAYGDKVDGLLGMSFLSRFDMTIDARSVRLKSRDRR